MTASRRQFTFGALMLALSGKAHAAKPGPKLPQQQQARPTDPVPTPTPLLSPRWAVGRKGKELHVFLALENAGDPTDVIVKWGSRLGPSLTAAIAVEDRYQELAQVFDVDRRELVSRMGPRPTFAPLARNGVLEIGTYRFAWVDGLPEDAVRLTLKGETADGTFELGPQDVSWKRAET